MKLRIKKWRLGLLAVVVILSGAVIILWPTSEALPPIVELTSSPDNSEEITQINSDPEIEASTIEPSVTVGSTVEVSISGSLLI